MASSVIKYSVVNPKAFTVSPPIKDGTRYSSKILYSEKDILIQTPELEVTEENTFRFKMVNNGLFFTLLEEIQETIVNFIFEKSSEYFSGKSFSKERIKNSMKDLCEIRDSYVYVNGTVLEPNAKFIDYFNEPTSKPSEFPYSGKFMINLSYILFGKTTFDIRISARSCKLSLKKDTTPGNKEYLFDDPEEVTQETSTKEPELGNSESEYNTLDEQNYTDDLDFF